MSAARLASWACLCRPVANLGAWLLIVMLRDRRHARSHFRIRHKLTGSPLLRPGCEMLERHDQLPGLAPETLEPMVAIERRRSVVLGIDHQGKHGNLGANGPHGGICEQCATEFLPPKRLIHSQATD